MNRRKQGKEILKITFLQETKLDISFSTLFCTFQVFSRRQMYREQLFRHHLVPASPPKYSAHFPTDTCSRHWRTRSKAGLCGSNGHKAERWGPDISSVHFPCQPPCWHAGFIYTGSVPKACRVGAIITVLSVLQGLRAWTGESNF